MDFAYAKDALGSLLRGRASLPYLCIGIIGGCLDYLEILVIGYFSNGIPIKELQGIGSREVNAFF